MSTTLIKSAATSWGVTTGSWILTEAVLGGWGAFFIAIPVTLGSTIWLAHRVKKIDHLYE